MQERAPAIPFKRHKTIKFRQEGGRWGDAITGRYDAMEIVVSQDGEIKWSKTVTPFFVWLRQSMEYVPKPFYEKRIEMAMKKAQKKAEKLNSK